MKSIDIICPLYNGEKYVESQLKQIENQTIYNKVQNIRYIITKGNDNTEKIVKNLKQKNNKILYKIIEKKDFSHSLTREKEVKESNADLIVFITQDVKIENDVWLEKLVNPINDNKVCATYSRQICKDKTSIEYYTRQKNYPKQSKIKTKEDIKYIGINAFFFSDASSCIKRDVFIKLNGFDGKNLPSNEDMYIAYKILTNNYKIGYIAESEVIHSHKFTLNETYNRYKAYGKFLKQEPEVNIKSTKSGGNLAKFIIKQAIKDKNYSVIFKFLPDMVARYIGLKVGKNNG